MPVHANAKWRWVPTKWEEISTWLAFDRILHATLRLYLETQKNPVGGAEVKVKYGQTSYNSIRVCNTDIDWTYVGVTHEYVMSNTPNTNTVVIPYNSNLDVYVLHDLSNLYSYVLDSQTVIMRKRKSDGHLMRSFSWMTSQKIHRTHALHFT